MNAMFISKIKKSIYLLADKKILIKDEFCIECYICYFDYTTLVKDLKLNW